MKFLHTDMIVVHPRAGCTIVSATREAIILSMEQETNVKLVFNDREYIVNYEEIFESIANQNK